MIKFGDTFMHKDYPGCVMQCVRVGAGGVWSPLGWHHADECTFVRVTIKTPWKIKPSELRAWLMSLGEGNWELIASTDPRGPDHTWMAGGLVKGVGWVRAYGPTEAKAIIAIRKALRAKGITL